MPGLTTHVLDIAHGRPAAGVTVILFRQAADGQFHEVASAKTNADGRSPAPLLNENELTAGVYQLQFHVADYFRRKGVDLTEPPFLDVVPVSFGVADATSHYHVPLLVSPYGYSTYRGS